MSYYRKKVYDSHNGDSGLNARTGQVVEVLRELTDRWLILFLSAMSSGTSATIWQTDICRFARLAGLMAVR